METVGQPGAGRRVSYDPKSPVCNPTLHCLVRVGEEGRPCDIMTLLVTPAQLPSSLCFCFDVCTVITSYIYNNKS